MRLADPLMYYPQFPYATQLQTGAGYRGFRGLGELQFKDPKLRERIAELMMRDSGMQGLGKNIFQKAGAKLQTAVNKVVATVESIPDKVAGKVIDATADALNLSPSATKKILTVTAQFLGAPVNILMTLKPKEIAALAVGFAQGGPAGAAKVAVGLGVNVVVKEVQRREMQKAPAPAPASIPADLPGPEIYQDPQITKEVLDELIAELQAQGIDVNTPEGKSLLDQQVKSYQAWASQQAAQGPKKQNWVLPAAIAALLFLPIG